MNLKIKEYLEKFNADNGYGTSDKDIIETLLEEEEVYRETLTKHRWWIGIFVVVDVGGKLIGYDWAETTGDNTAEEAGWEFDPESICEVKTQEVKQIIYKRIPND